MESLAINEVALECRPSQREGTEQLRVLALASYPVRAAATRYRLVQYVHPLAKRGISLEIKPFLDDDLFVSLYRRGQVSRLMLGGLRAFLKRFGDAFAARGADLIFVQREAMMIGPPLFEWLSMRFGDCPLVLDLDDATYIPYSSPSYGRLGSALKCFGKTDRLIQMAHVVICGNQSIAEHVIKLGTRAAVLPTVVDTEVFRPRATQTESVLPVLGWIGTHSTYPYLERIFPALERLARKHRFLLRIIGSGRETVSIPGVHVETSDWCLESEVRDFQSLDIGLYPITADEWSAGKSGFKAIQYMSIGIPFVTTPVGICSEIGEPKTTHFLASSMDEWFDTLSMLLSDVHLRCRMGIAGREHALRHYTITAQTTQLARILLEAGNSRHHGTNR